VTSCLISALVNRFGLGELILKIRVTKPGGSNDRSLHRRRPQPSLRDATWGREDISGYAATALMAEGPITGS
jgi:hypothetical protein